MRVALVNYFHAGDVILCRGLIRRVRPLLIDHVALELRCHPKYGYLWADLGLPIRPGPGETPSHDPDLNVINMWFGHGGDLLGVSGLSHATHVTSYNRQATPLGLPTLDPSEPVPPIDFPDMPVNDAPGGVLVENGPVLSGQKTYEITPFVRRLAQAFRGTTFYCTATVSVNLPNVVDVSGRNLIQISALSNVCRAMVARLSGPFVASLTHKNKGRMKRLVFGKPLGCPIWDESDCEYHYSYEAIENRLRELLS